MVSGGPRGPRPGARIRAGGAARAGALEQRAGRGSPPLASVPGSDGYGQGRPHRQSASGPVRAKNPNLRLGGRAGGGRRRLWAPRRRPPSPSRAQHPAPPPRAPIGTTGSEKRPGALGRASPRLPGQRARGAVRSAPAMPQGPSTKAGRARGVPSTPPHTPAPPGAQAKGNPAVPSRARLSGGSLKATPGSLPLPRLPRLLVPHPGHFLKRSAR